MRLGDLDELKKDLRFGISDAPLYIQATVDQYIDEAPVIDAVHVTRCENCCFADWAAWARKYTCGKIQGLLVSGDHYCASGKGRE